MGRSAQHSRTFHWSGYLLGFGLGGFFDGILLHQILQWHHLLSLVEGVGDIRNQVVMDGLFHALMYVIATAGLLLLWHSRHELSAPTAGRLLFCDVLIGFGVWHVLDSVLSHWVLGIHRIKLDSPTPLVWDLIWFAAFGLLPLLIGLLLRRDGGPAKGISGRSAALGLCLLSWLAGGGPVERHPMRAPPWLFSGLMRRRVRRSTPSSRLAGA